MAVRFSADGQDYTRSVSLGTFSQFSVACWVRLAADRNDEATFWCLDAGSSADYFLLQAASDGTGLLAYNDGTPSLAAMQQLTVGTWYYVAVTVNGSSCTVLVRTATGSTFTTYTPTIGSTTTAPTTLRIGESVFGTEWLNGNIAAFKLWTGATLTAAELELESWTTTPRRTNNLTAWYPFTIAETVDYSGNGLALSGGTGAATEDGPPVAWHQGRRPPITVFAIHDEATPSPILAPWTIPAPGISAGLTVETGPILAPWNVPTPDVSTTGSPPTQVTPVPIHAPWSIPAPAIRVDVTVSPAPIVAAWTVPAPEVGVPINPGDDLDGPGQLSLAGFRMGGGTAYHLTDELVGADIDLPQVDEGDVLNPSSDGAQSGTPLPQPRYITATFNIKVPGDQIREVVETFRDNTPLADADEELDLAIQILDRIYTTRAKVIRRTAIINKNYRLGLAKAVLQVKCIDPRLYSRELGNAVITDGGTVEVTNLGNRRTFPLVRVPGPAVTPRLEVFRTLSDGTEDLRVLEFNLTVGADELLIVDVANGTAEIAGESVESDLTGASIGLPDWVLGRGGSEISYETATGTAPAVTAFWRHAWL